MGEIAQKGKKQQPKNQKGVTYFCVCVFFKYCSYYITIMLLTGFTNLG